MPARHFDRSAPAALCLLIAGLLATGHTVRAADRDQAALEQSFQQQVQPFVAAYCQSCHGSEQPKGKLDLTRFLALANVTGDFSKWEAVLERLQAKEMPPDDAARQPRDDERAAVIQWIRAVRSAEAQSKAGDPGVVRTRRLNSAEYNYSIRDLTGVDIRPAKEFPVDPANEAGFDNSAESLAMSPALLEKYLAAARYVAEHLVLRPQGIAFAPHSVMTDTDRDKYCVNRILRFYQRQPTDLAAYFLAAWKFQHRAALENPDAKLADMAQEGQVSPKYLALVWAALTEQRFDVGPMARLQAMWRGLPLPNPEQPQVANEGCRQMREFVLGLRRKLEPPVKNLKIQGVHDGSQPFVLWKNRQYAANRRTYHRDALQVLAADGGAPSDADLLVPADPAESASYEASFARFADVFPDAFYISERGRDYVGKPKDEQEKGRLLSAGFHSQMGYFRDDGPLYDLVLDERQQAELDALWQELDFVANVPLRQYQGFLWFDRTDSRFMRDPQFDFARAEDKDATAHDKIERLREVYQAKARANGGQATGLLAIGDYFREIDQRMRSVERTRTAAAPTHLAALLDFAGQAWRRPLSQIERDDLLAFYRSLRAGQEMTHEEAVQDTLVAVLMSPHFCYRLDLAGGGDHVRPLTDHELASRLSFFLWSSTPDAELLARAAAGDLHEPAVLIAQTRRMLSDQRIGGLAVEFGGNWLDFRRFEEHNAVDRERFPTFTNELRQAMFEEPVRFFLDIVQNDRSALEFLYGRHTFVNRILAEHYGLPDLNLADDEWVRIDDAAAFGRGGLLPMAAFLTQNSPGLRTSPVKRGYWVVRRLLGERIPAPPPNVPEIPSDETKLGELTLREILARHRDHASCAGCHERFDSFGLVFEGYGPIGERRERDLGGRAVDVRANFPGGTEAAGLAGLQDFLRQHRQQDFLDNLCHKLLSYALGRSLLPSDDATLGDLRERLTKNEYRFRTLVEAIVTSRQFGHKRAPLRPDRAAR